MLKNFTLTGRVDRISASQQSRYRLFKETSAAGRKLISDKTLLLRIYLEEGTQKPGKSITNLKEILAGRQEENHHSSNIILTDQQPPLDSNFDT